MAVSKMKRISMIAAREKLDDLLKSAQQLRSIQVRDVAGDFNEYRQASQLTALVNQFDEENQVDLTDQEAIQYLSKREKQIEHAIKQHEKFIPKVSAMQKLKTGKKVYDYASLESQGQTFKELETIQYTDSVIKRLQSIDEQIEADRLEIDELEKWKKLDLLPKVFDDFQLVKGVIGTIPSTNENEYLQAIKQDERIVYQEVFMTDKEYGLIIFFKQPEVVEILEDLARNEFKKFDYHYDQLPAERIDDLMKQITELQAQRQSLVDEMSQRRDVHEQLQIQHEYVSNLLQRESAKLYTGQTEHLVAVEGWIEADQEAAFVSNLKAAFPNELVINSHEVEESDYEEVPVKLKNHPLVEPFELVTKMYALPKYNEVDPTPFLMPFYFVFFGMMVADVGYGLLMIIATFLVLKGFKLEAGMRNFMKFFHILGWSTVLWGLIYGSAFGMTLPFKLIDTNKDVTTVLILSIIFGVIQILLGLGLSIYQNTKQKDYLEAYKSGLSWFLLIVGIGMMVVGMLFPGFKLMGTIGKWVAIINAIGVVAAAVLKSKRLSGLGAGLYDLYGISSYVGDLVSYTRLMALGLSGGSIAAAFNMIIDFLPPLAKFSIGILLFILLHALNIFLSLLGAYVHGARLMFVEFFSKFYSGGGKAFSPLQPTEKYIHVITNQKMEEQA